MLLLAAHQGEEFVLALPAIMLAGAFFILRWANQKDPEETTPDAEETVSEDAPLKEDAVQPRR
jgi:hypothetical protein